MPFFLTLFEKMKSEKYISRLNHVNTLPDHLVALMLSISTLQIQSVKNVIENDRTLPPNKHN